MSSIFDLDPKGARETYEYARAHPLDLNAAMAPGAFTNFFPALGEHLESSFAKTGNFFLSLPSIVEKLDTEGPGGEAYQSAASPAHRLDTSLKQIGADAVDYWAPDAADTGAAGNILGSFLEIAAPLALTGGNPLTLVGSTAVNTKQELERQGVDSKTATRAGLIEGVVTLAGFKVPILGKTLTSRLATGAAGNVLFGMGAEEAQKLNLQASGYDKQAAERGPSMEAGAVDLLTGLVFGGIHHLGHTPTRIKDAVLTVTSAEHFRQSSLPDYEHATPGQQARGEHALEQAMQQVLDGEPVHVADKLKPEDSARIERAMQGRTGYAEGIEPRKEGEDDKAYAKRVIDQLPEPKPEQLPDEPARYFRDIDVSPLVPLDDLVSSKSEAENAKGGTNGLKRMAAAADGVLGKREPISVRDNGDGTYTVLDGNGTLTAARKAGFEALPVRVEEVHGVQHEGLQARYDAAAKVLPKFRKLAQSIAQAVHGRAVVPGLKGAKRALAKVLTDYRGDAGKIKDLVRGTIEINDPADAERVVAAMRKRHGKPVKLKSTLDPNAEPFDESGYRGLNAVWRIDGEPVELQVNVPEMLEAKEQVHDLYEERSQLERQIKDANRKATPEERERLMALNQEMAAVFEPAWAAATRRLKSGSDRGTPSSRNTPADSMTGRPEDQSSATPSPGVIDQGAPSTSANRVPGGKDLGSEGDLRPDMGSTSDASIPKSGADNAHQLTPEALAEQVMQERPDMPVVLADGTQMTVREALTMADDTIQQAETDAKGFAAAVACALRYLT